MRTLQILLLALHGIRRRPLRVGLTALGVAIASGAIISMVGFALGLQGMIETPLRDLALLNNIQVRPKLDERREEDRGRRAPGGPADGAAVSSEPNVDVPKAPPPPLDDGALRRIEEIPGVEVAYPELRAAGIRVILGDREGKGVAFGLPVEALLMGAFRELIVAGEVFESGGAPQALVGRRLSETLGFDSPDSAVGATVTLEASGLRPEDETRFSFERRRFDVEIVGVFDPPAMAEGFAGNGIILPVELMVQIPGIRSSAALDRLRAGREAAEGYSRVQVRVARPGDVPAVEARIREMGFETSTVLGRIERMRTLFIFLDALLACVGTVALVVSALGITNTLLMAVLERKQEIGISKAIGASEGDLRLLFLAEAGAVGLLGGLGGIALGRAVSSIIETAVNAYARGQGIRAYLEVFAFPAWLLAGAVAFAVAISVIAGLFPAARVARLDPIQALRGE